MIYLYQKKIYIYMKRNLYLEVYVYVLNNKKQQNTRKKELDN